MAASDAVQYLNIYYLFDYKINIVKLSQVIGNDLVIVHLRRRPILGQVVGIVYALKEHRVVVSVVVVGRGLRLVKL